MPGILLDPNNRLLGGATGDFSLYGGLPAVTIGTARPPAADPSLLTVPSATPTQPGPAPAAAPEAPAFADLAPLATDPAGSAAPLGGPLQSAEAPTAFAAPATTTTGPQVPAPSGSGSTAPFVPDTGLPVTGFSAATDPGGALSHGLTAASLAAPVLAAAEAAPLADMAALAPAITALATPALDFAAGTVAGTLSVAGTATTDTAALLDGVAHDAALPAIDTTVGAVDTALPVADTALAAGGEAVGGVSDTATHAVDGLAATATEGLATTTATAATATDTAADSLADTAAAATGLSAPLMDDQFAGTDPAGGVTTLVSMVETSQLFEVGQPSEPAEAATASGSIIDTLAADEAPAALLGDAAHTTDDLAIHHDDGVPGLP